MIFPEEIKVILESNHIWTNFLLILNIIVTIIVSLFIRRFIEKKTKEYEVKAHKDKLIAENVIKYCLLINKDLSFYCSKNPHQDISLTDVENIQKLKREENTIFINNNFKMEIDVFIDYLISLKDTPTNKDPETEKFFFHKLRRFINA